MALEPCVLFPGPNRVDNEAKVENIGLSSQVVITSRVDVGSNGNKWRWPEANVLRDKLSATSVFRSAISLARTFE